MKVHKLLFGLLSVFCVTFSIPLSAQQYDLGVL